MSSGSGLHVASLAVVILDGFCLAMQPVSDQGMHPFIGNPKVGTIRIGIEKSRGGDVLLSSAPPIYLRPGDREKGKGFRGAKVIGLTERAIPLAFGFHHPGFWRLGWVSATAQPLP